MPSVVRKASLLIRIIFHFVKVNIFQKAGTWIQSQTQGNAKVTEVEKKYSTANKNDFFDICGASAAEEQPGTSLNQGEGSKGEGHGLGSVKLPQKRKKRTLFRKNKVSPMEKIAWENDRAKNGAKEKKSSAARLFTSQSTKASNIRKDFAKPCYNRKDDRPSSKPASRSFKGNRTQTKGPSADDSTSFYRQGASQMQAVENKTGEESIKPGPSGQDWDNMSGVNQRGRFAPSPDSQAKIVAKWNGFKKRGKLPKSGPSVPPDFSNDQDMTSASSELKQRSELPSGLWSKMTFRRKAFSGKEE